MPYNGKFKKTEAACGSEGFFQLSVGGFFSAQPGSCHEGKNKEKIKKSQAKCIRKNKEKIKKNQAKLIRIQEK